MTIANPELPGKGQFKSPFFLKLGEGRFHLDWSTSFSGTVRVPSLTFKRLTLHLEQRGGKSNYQIILD